MEILLIIGLGVAIIWLKNRIDILELQVKDLEASGIVAESSTATPAATTLEPAEPPATDIAKEEGLQEAQFVSPDYPEGEAEAIADVPTSASFVGDEQPQYGEDFADEATQPVASRPRFDFEDIFGRRLPIWAGGITLAIAGIFLVRYSIESGLLTPVVRVALSFLFGIGLLGGAEWAYRNEAKVADERVRQALAGAGLATLYAAFYLAGTQYGLIGQTAAFLGLAAVTTGAIALSYRFGLPCAILGLVGGFAAPVLVGGDDANLPLLSLYLGLVTAGLTTTGQRQKRPWLSIAALVVGLGWGALLLLSGDPGVAEVIALGLYFIVLGAVLPAFVGAEGYDRPLRFGAAAVASVQLALLVDQAGYGVLAWSLYLLMGGTLAYFAWSREQLRETSAVAAIAAILLLAQWDGATTLSFGLVTAAIAVIYAAAPLIHLWRGKETLIDLAMLVGVPLSLAVIAYAKFGAPEPDIVEPGMAMALVSLASLPLAGAWRIWRRDGAARLAMLIAAGSLLVFGALLLVTPSWLAGTVGSAVALAQFALLRTDERPAIRTLLWSFTGLSFLAFLGTSNIVGETARLVGATEETHLAQAIIRWIAAGLPWLALALTEKGKELRAAGEIGAAALAYGLVAQFLLSEALTWAAALGALALWRFQPTRIPAQAALLVIAAMWSFAPLVEWIAAGALAIAGDPLLVSRLPEMTTVGLRLLPLTLALAVARPDWSPAFQDRPVLQYIAAALGLIMVHILFKHVLAIDDLTRFADRGLAERTLWQAFLLLAAWSFQQGFARFEPAPRLARGLVSLALAHAIWFSFLLHQPLWETQWVGPVPIANLVLASGAIAISACLMLRSRIHEQLRPGLDAVIMALASITALGLLRQMFAGAILVDVPIGQGEDLLRSLLGILLALGFLYIGNRRGERSWRVGSLVLMLIAVAKVFLVDAAGLAGLLRVASFMALGFSLIGIGWIYSRQLRSADPG